MKRIILFIIVFLNIAVSLYALETTDIQEQAEPIIKSSTITLVSVGDILLARKGIEILIKKYGEEYPFKKVASYIQNADIGLGNLESCISERGVPYDKEFTFRASPKRIESLKYAGFDILNTANNHAGDFGQEALSDTLDILNKNNFKVIGSGKNREDANRGVIVEKNGIKVGFLSYSAVLSKSYQVRKISPGTVSSWPDTNIRNNIKRMKKEADLVVVSFHWGKERVYEPTEYQTYLAHLSINAGADLVFGHHPHVIQGMEVYKGKPIFYSLGNFVFIPYDDEAKETILVECTLEKDDVKEITIHPVFIHYGQPRVVDGEQGLSIAENFIGLSNKFGTEVNINPNTLVMTWKRK